MIAKNCQQCQEPFMALQTEVNRGGGKFCSRQCWYDWQRANIRREEQSPNWKGDQVGYDALHDWVRRQKGTPSECEMCATTEGFFEWANISGLYKRDINDWIRLCRRCHTLFDNKPEKRKVTLLERYGRLDIVSRNLLGQYAEGKIL